MAFQPVPLTVEYALKGNMADAVPWEMSFYQRFPTTPTFDQATADAIATGIRAAYTDNGVDDRLSSTWTWNELIVTYLGEEDGFQFEAAFTALTGGQSANPLPNGVAALVSWATNTRSRNARGRTFHGGFSEADSAGNGLSSGLLTDVGGWAGDLIGFFSSVSGYDMVVVSRYDKDSVPTPPHKRAEALTFPISGGFVHPAWKSQRRRNLTA